MRAPILLFFSVLSLLALAGACGGGVEVGPGPGDGGSSSSSGGSSTSSGASGSSGSNGSSSGASSGGSGTSSGGVTCAPLPGCDSSVECPLPGGCGTCYCENGGWACAGTGCGDDVSDAYPVDDAPYGVCPLDPPNPGTLCETSNVDCSYGSAEGCGESCYCENGTWACAENPCPPPVCPPVPPPSGSICGGIGGSCFYPVNNSCGEEECDCDPSGTWGCYEIGCFDGGGPDTGTPDTGTFDGGGPCPGSLPAMSSACSEEGLVCSYFSGCEYNCLCASSGWVCAPEGPCAGGG